MNNDIMNANLLSLGKDIDVPDTTISGDSNITVQSIRPGTSVFQMPDGGSAVVDESGNILEVK